MTTEEPQTITSFTTSKVGTRMTARAIWSDLGDDSIDEILGYAVWSDYREPFV